MYFLFGTWVCNNKICSTNDYTFFLWGANESLYSIQQKGTQKEKKFNFRRWNEIHALKGGISIANHKKNKEKSVNYLPF